MKKLTPLFFALFYFLSFGNLHAAPQYELIDLGTMGNKSSVAKSINNNGVVVGYTGGAAFKWQPAPYTPPDVHYLFGFGRLTILPCDIVAPDGVSATGCYAAAINDRNEVVGSGSFDETNHWDYMRGVALMWDKNDDLTLITSSCAAVDINNSQQVLIHANTSTAGTWSAIWDQETDDFTELVSYLDDGIYPYSEALNDKGQVVGGIEVGDWLGATDYAFLWEGGVLHDLNDLALDPALSLVIARDVNNSGHIVGSRGVTYRDGTRSFVSYLYVDGTVIDLKFEATALNDAGQVVGSHFLYDKDGTQHDLNDLVQYAIRYDCKGACRTVKIAKYDDLVVNDINNRGEIVGSATIQGTEHAVLLSPIPAKPKYPTNKPNSLNSSSILPQ